MDELVKQKHCTYCGRFERYYIKGTRRFELTKFGFCYLQNKIVCNTFCCESYIPGSRKVYLREKAICRALREILSELSSVRQIMQEMQEEGSDQI